METDFAPRTILNQRSTEKNSLAHQSVSANELRLLGVGRCSLANKAGPSRNPGRARVCCGASQFSSERPAAAAERAWQRGREMTLRDERWISDSQNRHCAPLSPCRSPNLTVHWIRPSERRERGFVPDTFIISSNCVSCGRECAFSRNYMRHQSQIRTNGTWRNLQLSLWLKTRQRPQTNSQTDSSSHISEQIKGNAMRTSCLGNAI